MSYLSKITIRNTPISEVTTREVAIDLGSLDSDKRTVNAAFTTETPVPTWQWDVRQVVDEVLLSRGMLPVEHVSMLAQHYHYDPQAVIGSGINPRAQGSEVVGTLQFGVDLGDQAEAIWKRVQQRHMRSVSAGYDVLEWVDIPPGESRDVLGKTYTAGKRTLRVTTKWRLREISVVVIPADPNAQMRAAGNVKNGAENTRDENDGHNAHGVGGIVTQENGSNAMGLIAYLRSLGLAENADSQAISLFVRGLSSEQRTKAQGLAANDAEKAYFVAEGGNGSSRSGGGQGEGAGHGSGGSAPSQDPITQLVGARGSDGDNGGTALAVTLERQRISDINRLAAGQVPDDLIQRAIDEGWTVDRAGREFFNSVAQSRSNPVGHGGHVGIHSRSASSEVTLQALQVGLMMRLGIEPDSQVLATPQARGMLGHYESRAGWIAEAAHAMRSGNAGDEASRAIEVANRRLRRRSLPDIAAECLRIAGRDVPEDREEMVRRAYTTSPFQHIFTTNFSAKLLVAYMEHPDTTEGWVQVEDLPDFNSHDLVQDDPLTNLRKKTKNLPGQQLEGSDRKESYAAERFVGAMSIDEVDIINDRLRAFQRKPAQMGASARRIRMDLVFAVLLQNPTLAMDSVALFAVAHGNLLGSAALSPTTLNAAIAAMTLHKRNGALLDCRATHLVVPSTKKGLADTLVGSSELRNTTDSTEYGTMNYNRGLVTPVGEARLDTGFADPDDPQTTIAGQPNSWWLFDANKSPIFVGYVEGTGRAPRLRSRVIDRTGEYGLEWDVLMDIGIGVADYPGAMKRQAGSL